MHAPSHISSLEEKCDYIIFRTSFSQCNTTKRCWPCLDSQNASHDCEYSSAPRTGTCLKTLIRCAFVPLISMQTAELKTHPNNRVPTGFSALMNEVRPTMKHNSSTSLAPARQTLLPASSASLCAPPAITKFETIPNKMQKKPKDCTYVISNDQLTPREIDFIDQPLAYALPYDTFEGVEACRSLPPEMFAYRRRTIPNWIQKKPKDPTCAISAQLAPWEIDFIDQSLAYALPYDTFEVAEACMSLPLGTFVYHRRNSRILVNYGTPKKRADLFANLFSWILSPFGPAPSFADLYAYHCKYFPLQSQKSFRLLARVAVDEANFGAVRTLLRQMEVKGIVNDWRDPFWTAWVRHMVRRGDWGEAWQIITRSFRGQSGIPLRLWIEFWGSAKLRAKRRLIKDDFGNMILRPVHLPYELNFDMSRYHVLMDNMPSITESEARATPARLVYAIVRARLWSGKREWAMELTKDYFRNAIDDAEFRWCLKLLNLHLGLGWVKMGFPTLRSMQRIMDELLELQPSVKPDSTALFLLLRALKGTKHCGIHASWLINEFKARYGDSIVDQKVRRRAASLAAKSGERKLFRRMIRQERKARKKNDLRELWHWRKLNRQYRSME
jgi:hypothetical protein